MSIRMLPAGHAALLVECDGLAEVLALHDGLARSAPAGVVEFVPAARTLLVGVDPAVLPLESAENWIRRTAALLGVSAEALVRAHTSAEWRVAFVGFAPGFGYLVSDDWPFQVPRLESPRTRVPAGSVALAGAFAGAYPRESPGGWRLVGRTDVVLWDAASDDPALFAPARRVRFRAVRP